MKRGLLYLILMGVVFCVAVTGQGEFPRFLLAFLLMYAAVSFVWVRMAAKKTAAEIFLPVTRISRGDKFQIQVKIRNRGQLPLTTVQIKVRLTEVLRNDESIYKEVTGYAGVDRKGNAVWQVWTKPVHCGVIQAEIREVYVWDYIGLCRAAVKAKLLPGLVSVCPNISQMEWEGEVAGGGRLCEAAQTVAAGRGEDTQEIFDTRFYQQGDVLRSIHWKLSAKEDELLVKEFSRDEDVAALVIADGSKENSEEIMPDEKDAFLDKCVSLSGWLLENKMAHEFMWMTGKDTASRLPVKAECELYELSEEILGINMGAGVQLTEELAGKSEEFRNIIRVTPEGIFVS